MKSIQDLEFGFADAANYQKRDNKNLFNKIFVRGEYLDKLCSSNISFLIGEKGSGKTAYAVYLTNNNYKNIFATTRFVRETDYSKFMQLKRDKHLNVSDFISIWKVILYLLLADQIKEKESDLLSRIFQYPQFKSLNEAIDEYYAGAFSPEIVNAMTIVENSKEAAELFFKYAKLNGEETRQITFTESKFQINLMYIEKKFRETLSKLKLKGDHILFIDGIDVRPSHIPFNEYQECVKGLANAIWHLNNDVFPKIRGSKGRIRIVLLIRPDIFNSLGLQNQNTKIQDNSVFLDWRTSYSKHRESKIFNIFDHLLKVQQEDPGLKDGDSWDYYFPWDALSLYDKHTTKTSFISFLRNSYYRPRDILQMLKFLQENLLEGKEIVDVADFENLKFQKEYSNYLLGEIRDHLLFYYEQEDYQKFLKFFEFLNGKNKFSYQEYSDAFVELTKYLSSTGNSIPKFMTTPNEFLQFLFDINVICYIEVPENSDIPRYYWCFKERKYANISPEVKTGIEYQVFYGLAKALNLGSAFKR